VPLVAAGDVAVGALCLADALAQRCDAESLVILEQLGRRGARLLSSKAGVTPGAASGSRAPLLAQDTFEVLLEMELRLARRHAETLELAAIQLAPAASSVECAQRLWDVSAGARVAVGSLGPRHVGFCQRGPAPRLDLGVEAVRTAGLATAAGVVSATGDVGLSEPAMTRLAERALLTALNDPSHPVSRIVVGPGHP
jgi:hypothetical protein